MFRPTASRTSSRSVTAPRLSTRCSGKASPLDSGGTPTDQARRLGLLGPADDLPPSPPTAASPVSALASLLAHKLRYLPGERDLVLLTHELGVRTRSGAEEVLTSSLVAYGAPFGGPGHSAMATTVGVPVALGALLLADGGVASRGVMAPTEEEVWRPLLARLKEKGLKVEEGRRKGKGMADVLARQMQSRLAT